VCLQQCPGRNSARWAPVKPWQVVPAVVSAGSFCPRLHGALCHVRWGGNGRVQLNGTAGTAELVYRGNLIRRDRTTAREGAWRAASARVQTPRAMRACAREKEGLTHAWGKQGKYGGPHRRTREHGRIPGQQNRTGDPAGSAKSWVEWRRARPGYPLPSSGPWPPRVGSELKCGALNVVHSSGWALLPPGRCGAGPLRRGAQGPALGLAG